MKKKAAVFCCKGLGDGLISLTLSHNLELNGWKVTTFHPFLHDMQSWFSHLPITEISEKTKESLFEMDKIFFFYEKLEPMQSLIQQALKQYPEKTFILNPIATTNKNYPFWAHGKFDGEKTFVDNLIFFCKNILDLPHVERSNGLVPPFELKRKEKFKRVVIHPTSSREGKNWPKEKYVELIERLQKKGFQPYLILQAEEKRDWEELKSLFIPAARLDSMAAFIYQSGYFIGNDSGIGHLASCLGLPTLTICRSCSSLKFWRPAWSFSKLVSPSLWIPNIKFLRIRDKYWKKWVSVDTVEKAFDSLLSEK